MIIDTESFPRALQASEFMKEANLGFFMDDDDMRGLGQTVVREYKLDKESRQRWERENEEAFKLAKQAAESKTFPWEGAANVKYPLITVAAIQFAARTYPVIVDNNRVAKGRVIGDDSGIPQTDETGQVLQDEEGNIQFEVEPGAKREKADRLGEHMSYQLLEQIEEWEPDTDYLLHALPIAGCMFRKTWYDPGIGRTRSQVVSAMDVVVNQDTANRAQPPRLTHILRIYHNEIHEKVNSGLWMDRDIQKPSEDEDGFHIFLEQHRLLDLDGDGYKEPYIVTVHEKTMSVVRIAPRFDEDSIHSNGDRIVKIDPVKFFEKYDFLPDPEGGYYGIGFGKLLTPINESVNTVINQLLDSGTLQNLGGGFIGKGLRLKRGPMKFSPGEWKSVDVGSGSIRENVFALPVPQPSSVLFSMLGLLIDAAKDISSVKDVLTGERSPNTAATTTLALIEQGTKVFTGITKRIYRSLKGELRMLHRINRLFLDETEYFVILDTPKAVKQTDYEEDTVDVVPVADPAMVSDALRATRAEVLMSQLQNPFANGLEITRRFFEATGESNIDGLIVQPGPDPDKLIEIQRLENDRERIRVNAAEAQAKIVNLMADAIAKIAKADQEDARIGLEKEKAELSGLLEAMNAITGNVSGVAGEPGNTNGSQLPAGAGQGNPAGLV